MRANMGNYYSIMTTQWPQHTSNLNPRFQARCLKVQTSMVLTARRTLSVAPEQRKGLQDQVSTMLRSFGFLCKWSPRLAVALSG